MSQHHVSVGEQISFLRADFANCLPRRIRTLSRRLRNPERIDAERRMALLGELGNMARAAGAYGFTVVARHLQDVIDVLDTEPAPPDAERMADAVKTLAVHGKDGAHDAQVQTRVTVVVAHRDALEAHGLCLALVMQGFRAVPCTERSALADTLTAQSARAVVLDLELFEDTESCAQALSRLLAVACTSVPFVLLCRMNDTEARLHAMRAGAQAYFPHPVDTLALGARLVELVALQREPKYRVMLVHDGSGDVSAISAALTRAGIVSGVLSQPRRAVPAVKKFDPDLALIDSGMQQVDARKLAGLLHRQEGFEELPVVFFDTGTDGADGDDALRTEQLVAVVNSHAQRSWEQHEQVSKERIRGRPGRLCNRDYFVSAMEAAVASAAEQGSTFGVLHVAMDGLDDLLRGATQSQTAAYLKASEERLLLALRADDMAMRHARSVFVVLLKHVSVEDSVMVAERIRRQFSERVFDCGSHSFSLTCTIGVSHLDSATDNGDKVLAQAEAACTQARESGGDAVHLHDAVADALAREKRNQRIGGLLRQALDDDAFHVQWQPILGIRDEHILAHQVSISLSDEHEGELLAAQLDTIAEELGLRGEIDQWMVQFARRAGAAGADTPSRCFVSLSVHSLCDHTVRAGIERALASAPGSGPDLILGLGADVAAMHLNDAIELFSRPAIRDAGTALMQFGRASNPFAILKHLPVKFVVLDGTLTQNIAHDAKAEATLSTLVETLHRKSIAVIAPSVEDPHLMMGLWRSGVDFVEGMYLEEHVAASSDAVYSQMASAS